MDKRILVAFDDSENAIRTINFIISHFSVDCKVTIFSVLQDTAILCDMHSPELIPYFTSQQTNFCVLEDKKKELICNAQNEAKKRLIHAGFNDADITLITKKKEKGVARDIINEAKTGYDVVVLGRRGLSGIREFFLGSVSQKVIHAVKDVSVLIVK